MHTEGEAANLYPAARILVEDRKRPFQILEVHAYTKYGNDRSFRKLQWPTEI